MSAKKKILIIDDDNSITRVVKIGLERYGYSVDTYNDPVESVAKFRPGYYDLIFLDIRMPVLSGFDVYRRLKEADGAAKICFFTSFEINTDEFRKLFPDIDVSQLLLKPASIATMVGIIEGTAPK
jgi:DNA-binding response OmpR family regulator